MSGRTAIRPLRLRLWRKYLLLLSALVAVALGALGVVEMLFASREAERQARVDQTRVAQEIATSLQLALGAVERQLVAVVTLPWEQQGWLDLRRRRQEFQRLLLIEELLTEVRLVDEQGATLLRVSRRLPDERMADSSALLRTGPAPASGVTYGAVFYVDDYEPQVTMSLGVEGARGSLTLATLSLRVLAEQLRPLLSLAGGLAYAKDARGVVVLHADIATMLRREQPGSMDLRRSALFGHRGLGGAEVIATTLPLPSLGWTLVVEQPLRQALAPVRSSLMRIGAVTAGAMALAVLASFWMSRRMARPIAALSTGAARLAGGELDVRIAVNTRDELEDLAHQFNRMAQALQDNVAQLEQRVAEKTADLAAANADMERVNTELKRANFALQLASQHKSEFLAHMSHELRTPLNAILGFADVLKDGMAGPMSDDQREYAADIHASGLHLLELINDVLDLARIEAGQIVLQPTAFSVREIVDATLAMVRQRCVRAGLALELSVAPEVATWVADPRRFKQVLLNLLFNAAKFTPAGGVRVCVAIDAEAGLMVAVLDTGVGIAEADHERIFDPFYQVRREGQPAIAAQEGTGLGLPLARQLVRQHGGELWFTSRPGAGSGFFFNLPRSVG